MAVTLKLHFVGTGGRKIVLSFPQAKESAEPAKIKALMEGIVANKDIYVDAPGEIVKAEIYKTDGAPVVLPV